MKNKISPWHEKFQFKKKDLLELLQNDPFLKQKKESDLEETLITIGSLCFSNYEQVILEHPRLLSFLSYELAEKIQFYLKEHRDISIVQQKILEKDS